MTPGRSGPDRFGDNQFMTGGRLMTGRQFLAMAARP
jgi:hypothetical protein